jgi:hypothetical protein
MTAPPLPSASVPDKAHGPGRARSRQATAVSHFQHVTRAHDYEVTLVPARDADGHRITHRSGDDDGIDGDDGSTR